MAASPLPGKRPTSLISLPVKSPPIDIPCSVRKRLLPYNERFYTAFTLISQLQQGNKNLLVFLVLILLLR